MTEPQNLDAALCLLSTLIAKQVAKPGQLKRDLQLGAKHFSASNPELGSLLGRMSDAIKDAPPAASATDTELAVLVGRLHGIQAALSSTIRALETSDQVFGNFATDIEHARATLLSSSLPEEARKGLEQIIADMQQLQREL